MAIVYKQPRRLNGVTVTMLLLMGAAAYVGVSAWPVLATHADVKNEMEDALPRLYHVNLAPEPDATAMADDLRREVAHHLEKLGVHEAMHTLKFVRNPKIVAVELTYATTVNLRGTKKRFPLTLHPRVETDAARIDW